MAKHTQTIRWQIAEELFEGVWPFCGIGVMVLEATYFQQKSIYKEKESKY